MAIEITIEPTLSVEAYQRVLNDSGLGLRRPVEDLPRLEAMLRGASVIACARNEQGELVGLARVISDFAYASYLADLAVIRTASGQCIGRQLIAFIRTHLGDACSLIWIAAPAATSYYDHIAAELGIIRHSDCFMIPRDSS